MLGVRTLATLSYPEAGRRGSVEMSSVHQSAGRTGQEAAEGALGQGDALRAGAGSHQRRHARELPPDPHRCRLSHNPGGRFDRRCSYL